MKYYLGGFYLIKIKSLNFGTLKNKIVYTCSNCLNDSLVESWAFGWTTENRVQLDQAKTDFSINDKTVSEIQEWVNEKYNEKKIGWPNLFEDIETALFYKRNFFPHLTDIKLFSIYFNQNEAEGVLQEFRHREENMGGIGLCQIVSKRIEEKENSFEKLIGYDLIGIENGGDFHSFHCHELGKELSEKFRLSLNSFGLFDDCNDWQPVLDYLNDENNGFEPVPWFVTKMKLIMLE